VLVAIALIAAAAPALAPNDPDRQFPAFVSAPPMRPRLVDGAGVHAPFVHPLRLVDRLERRFELQRYRRVPLVWLRGGRLVSSAESEGAPLFLLGTDPLGRDLFARLVYGARTSLAVAGLATFGALLTGILIGGTAGALGGWIDETFMRAADFVLVLPSIYVVLALRSVLPLVLPASAVLGLLAGLLAVAGTPAVARGVRAVVAIERERSYVLAARSIGAGPVRLLCRHLLPAAAGFLGTQAVLLMPAFIVAEATLSFVGLGFPEPTASWGTMLADAANIRAAAEMPWLLSPVAAIVTVVLALNLAIEHRSRAVP
jgi:peptide/nickel transport system permease protein